jgi:hypothetical protein
MGIYKPWTGLISTSIPCSFYVSVWYLKGEFMLDRGVTNDFKKVVKSKEIVAFDWHITKFVEG